jgi:transcriptional regulator with XRE-family HTH domain
VFTMNGAWAYFILGMSINKIVGENIRKVRKKTGISQLKLSQRLGYTRVTVTNIEAGRQGLLVDRLLHICQILGCEYSDILPPIKKGS